MDEIIEYLKVKRNLINLLLLLIIVLGIPVAVNLIKQSAIFQSQADVVPIQVVENDCIKIRNGRPVAICPDVKLQLTSPLGPASGSGETR